MTWEVIDMRIQIVDDAGNIKEIEPLTLYVFPTDERYRCSDCAFDVDEFCCIADSPQEAIDDFINGYFRCVACELQRFGFDPLKDCLYGVSNGKADKGSGLFSSSLVGWFILEVVYLDESVCRDLERIGRETKVLWK
jgi:hypothetical protein